MILSNIWLFSQKILFNYWKIILTLYIWKSCCEHIWFIFWNTWSLTLPWDDINLYVFVWKNAREKCPEWYIIYISLNWNIFLWFNFGNIFNVCILKINTWTAIRKFRCHHAIKFIKIYSNGGHIGFNYTHTSLNHCSK